MLEQIQQIKILLANVNANMQAILQENERLRKELENRDKEINELRNNVATNKATNVAT